MQSTVLDLDSHLDVAEFALCSPNLIHMDAEIGAELLQSVKG